ncbi:fumarylacetoacetate hydrolase family protein [Paenibacillus sp. HB172176]|uniref:fumarylacetoacetate hydrolase family protein n=1 Tax=Paenibacillus sp. HB172176 TaxID=2493690 RepID=UPI00143A300D|nr:fumarylacetoacetate hydrolase family protein [Paenibacillus sp. HB172176]
MKVATIKTGDREEAAILTARGYVPLETINAAIGTSWATNVQELLKGGSFQELKAWYTGGGVNELAGMKVIALMDAVQAPLLRNPGKIWGIGMNYVRDEAELALKEADEEPVGFMKPSTTLIGPGDSIRIPGDAGVITAEAELAIVIGQACRGVSEADAHRYVAGFAASLDMTAADIHARNQRFLTRAKSYDTFLSLGSQLNTVDEYEDHLQINVCTALNGRQEHRNRLFHMKFRPMYAVAFHSSFMTLLPGDIILTGTPGAVVIREGDTAECRIDGFEPLVNPVSAMR